MKSCLYRTRKTFFIWKVCVMRIACTVGYWALTYKINVIVLYNNRLYQCCSNCSSRMIIGSHQELIE